ncbi:MAG: Nramp family divalent metal transporter [Ignavibacteriales bacterium]|nr:Nramp family divalent metal transporter [Ignavibacteriales bacterium]
MTNNKHSESLSDVHRSVSIPKNVGTLKRFFAFLGPAYLVSVGYMDPGNWATDLEGGARFGYSLIWVLLMSNLIAVLLQTLSARLGIVTGRDLAQACRENYPKPVAFILWVLCEIAIAACDLAEVLGTAIGLNLLLNVPLLYGVIITGFDTFLFLIIQNFGIRKVEAFIVMLISTIGLCFGIEIFLAEPVWGEVAKGFVPHLTSESLYVAIGILGATVMPHNLYLHSALVQTRDICETDECKKQACRWNFLDTSIALNAAFFVNAAILIVAASVFYKNGIVVTEIQQAHNLLTPLLGTTIASTLFALALLSAGQSSTLTGTLAGQIVMEGFLQFKMRPVIRRLITRMLAIVPAVIVLTVKGDEGSYGLLILSQVILSLQLPFAVVPLIHFTSDKKRMKQFANKKWVLILAWTAAAVIIALNARLVYGVLSEWIESAGSNAIWIWITAIPLIIGCTVLLLYMTFPNLWRKRREVAMPIPSLSLSHQTYTKIGVALDFGGMEETVLSHAQSIAQHHNAAIYLFHVVEGVSGQLFGKEAFDDEARTDKEHIENISEQLRKFGFEVHTQLGFGNVPKQLVKLANETQIDLLIMGGHRHSGLKDLIFGTTVPKVRHELKIPVMVV